MLRMNQSAEAVPAICTEHLIFLHSPSSLLPLSVEASPIIPGRIDETGRNEATRNTECSPPEDSIVSVRTDICLRLLNIHDSDSLLNLQEAEALQYSGRFPWMRPTRVQLGVLSAADRAQRAGYLHQASLRPLQADQETSACHMRLQPLQPLQPVT